MRLFIRPSLLAILFFVSPLKAQTIILAPPAAASEAYALGVSGNNVVGYYWDTSGTCRVFLYGGEVSSPAAMCKNVTVAAGPNCTANASIDNGSSDPGGLTITLAQSLLGPYPIGDTDVTLTVTNSAGASSQCTATVTVADRTAPTISIWGASPASLWPPNNKMSPIKVTAAASDSCSPPVTCKISSIESNERADWQVDMVITGDLTASLRADRLESGTGRIYRTTFQCTDGAGNIATKDVLVTIPHDKGKAK